MTQRRTIGIEGSHFEALVGEPSGSGPFPGVVVTHHGPGLDAFTDDFVEKLAAVGYVTVAPDFYHRGPEVAEIKDRVAALNDVQILNDIAATVAFLRSRPDVAPDRLGIVGHCLGGRNSLLGAAASDAFAACGVFYGGNIMAGRGRESPTPFDLIGDINCPVAGFFGNDDDNPSPDDVDKIDQEMDRLGIAHEFHRFDGAGHAFQNFFAEERYRKEASNSAQVRLQYFLGRSLVPA